MSLEELLIKFNLLPVLKPAKKNLNQGRRRLKNE